MLLSDRRCGIYFVNLQEVGGGEGGFLRCEINLKAEHFFFKDDGGILCCREEDAKSPSAPLSSVCMHDACLRVNIDFNRRVYMQ